jgi:hypothetical protein
MNMAALTIFQAWIWLRVVIRKFVFVYVLKTFPPRKLHVLGSCLHLAYSLFYCMNGLDIIMGRNGHVEELELNDT